jgi:hypothetical protein
VADELVTVPADLTLLSDSDLEDLEARAVAEFDRLNADDNVTPESLEYQIRLTNDLDRIRAEKAGRATRAQEAAARERARLLSERNDLQARVHGRSGDGNGTGGGGGGSGSDGNGSGSSVDVNAIAEAAAKGATAALVAALGQRRLDQSAVTQRATTSLADARRHQAQPPVPKQRLAVTAGVDIPGVARGSDLVTLDDLVNAIQRTAKTMPITRDGTGQERLVASIRNEFEHTVDDRTSPAQVEELLGYLRRPEKMESLLAGGGWCAPSEIRYEFFNVSDASGLVDLPTVGITRGGLRFPVSPSIADAFKNDAGATIGLAPFGAAFSNASDPWLWTETDDVASVTGAPLKPTLRVACPTFSEARLECHGVTMTAGNLTDDSYPEATAHTLRLLLNAWQHAQNARILSQMVALSSAAITGVGAANKPVFQTVMNGLSLATTDYKAKYGMNDDTICEVVAPFWLQELIQADLAWRGGAANAELLSVTDAQINAFAADRAFRVQWVNDWQVRGTSQFGNATTPLTAWPTTADVLVFAAGTFIKGNGMTLDLGVVRDSTLNKTNDFTAAWSEECHLIARVGNESRRYTLTFAVDGGTGGSVYVLGTPAPQI